jgi:PadR family transcriptional regulator, regulatory protein PadR
MGRGDQLQGTLELLILKTLARGPNHGFGITLHVESVSIGLLRLEEGSLYPALHRLEKSKLVNGEWRQTEKARRARVYTLTPAGRRRLTEAETNWTAVSKGVRKVLRFA